jgi:queuosine precursor transporter
MFELNATKFILFLQSLPPELISIFSLLCCYAMIITMAKIFGAQGLMVYNVVAIIACNLQVLKGTDYSFYSAPIALGTITYASSFLVSDYLTEVYGEHYARKCLFLSFFASIILLLMMIVTLGHRDITSDTKQYEHFHEGHLALSYIFTPNLAIVSASLTAYVLSQLSDIYIFAKLKGLRSAILRRDGNTDLFLSGEGAQAIKKYVSTPVHEKNKDSIFIRYEYIWFRTFVSLGFSAMLDSLVFNTLAWKVFSPYHLSWHSVFFNYMIGGYLIQLLVAFFNIFAMYLLLKIIKDHKLHAIS